MPAWPVRAADAAGVVLLVFAASIWITGGVRLRALGLRVSITSPLSVAAIALALVFLRHWRVRHPSMPTRVRDGVRRLWSDDAIGTGTTTALATRLATWVVGLYAVLTIGYGIAPVPFRISRNELLNLPARWDAGWYLGLANGGYRWDPRSSRQQNVAFFPAFPLLMRLGRPLLGGGGSGAAAAGMLISNLAFAWALVRLYRLVEARTTGGSRRAADAVLLLAAYPFSVFYGGLYTESLYLLAVVSAFWHAEHSRWSRVAAWGLLIGLVRPNGVFMCVPLGIIAARAWQAATPAAADRMRRLVVHLLAAAMPAIGLLLFSAYVYSLTGDPWHWADVQAAWGREFTGWGWIASPLDSIHRYGLLGFIRDAPADSLNLAATLFALALLVPVTWRLGLAYGAFVALNLIVPLARGGLVSTGRLSSTLFPVFIWLALRLSDRARILCAAGFAMGQGVMSILFYTWRPPY